MRNEFLTLYSNQRMRTICPTLGGGLGRGSGPPEGLFIFFGNVEKQKISPLPVCPWQSRLAKRRNFIETG